MKQLYARVGIVPALIALLFLFPATVGAQQQDVAGQPAPTETEVVGLTVTDSAVDPSGSIITLTVSEALIPRNIDGDGGFATDQEGLAVNHVIVHAQTVTLLLSQPLPEGVATTISYTAPGDGTDIVDTSGNSLGSGSLTQVTHAAQISDPQAQEQVPVTAPVDGEPVAAPEETPDPVAPVEDDTASDVSDTPPAPVVDTEIPAVVEETDTQGEDAPVTSDTPVVPVEEGVASEPVVTPDVEGVAEDTQDESVPVVEDTPTAPVEDSVVVPEGQASPVEEETDVQDDSTPVASDAPIAVQEDPVSTAVAGEGAAEETGPVVDGVVTAAPQPLLTEGSLTKESGEGVTYQYPSYTVTASVPGILTMSGDGCAIEDQVVAAGPVTIALSLNNGSYDCSIALRDDTGAVSEVHDIPTFTVDSPEGVLLSNPIEQVSVEERKRRVSFTIDVDHWFSGDETESIATITIGGAGMCKHFNDRLLSSGQFVVKRDGDQLSVSEKHEVRTAKLDDGVYEDCTFSINSGDPVAIKDFTIESEVEDVLRIQAPELPSDDQASSIVIPVADGDSETPDESSVDQNSEDVKPTAPELVVSDSEDSDVVSQPVDQEDAGSSEPVVDPTKPTAPQLIVEEPVQDDTAAVEEEDSTPDQDVVVLATPTGDPVTLRKGVVMEPVRDLQRFLNSQGGDFLVASEGPGSPGNETNIFGDATDAAVRRFQEARGEEVTGEVIVYIDSETDTTTFLAPFVVAAEDTQADLAALEQQIAEITNQIQEQMSTNPSGDAGTSQ
ncbi:MAG: peptidoglycan-binding protein [Candidatus Kaiserbacteria bacterium]|nr:peptidoglycan-binding protein [Candidatus Kaiserbacteria bacterium]